MAILEAPLLAHWEPNRDVRIPRPRTCGGRAADRPIGAGRGRSRLQAVSVSGGRREAQNYLIDRREQANVPDTASEAAAVGEPRERPAPPVVEGLHDWLGAVPDAVDVQLDVDMGCSAAPGVTGDRDLLPGHDLLAFVDEQGAVVAVGVAETDVGLDGDTHSAALTAAHACDAATGLPPVAVVSSHAGDGASGKG